MNINKIKASLGKGVTSFEPKIIITIPTNAQTHKEAKELIKEQADILEVKLKDWLNQFPYKIEIK